MCDEELARRCFVGGKISCGAVARKRVGLWPGVSVVADLV